MLLFITFQDMEGCRFKKDKIGAVVAGYTNIESGSEQQLMEAVATVGPISVAIDASHFSFKHFHGGQLLDLNSLNIQKLDVCTMSTVIKRSHDKYFLINIRNILQELPYILWV